MKQKLIILGAGESGVGAAILGKVRGYDVFVSDGGSIKESYRKELEQHNILFEEGGHSINLLENAGLVIKSPGIPEKAEIVKKIRQAGITLISEVEFAFQHKGTSKIVAITGSNGKSTTTSLIYHMFMTDGRDCALVGNIGVSFAKQVALDPKEWYILEVSSFQLDDILAFRPEVAILTNITEDHLDRYEYKVENYISSKFRITRNQTEDDYFIYSLDDDTTVQYLNYYTIKSHKVPFTMSKELPEGAYLRNAMLHIKWKEEEVRMSIDDFALKGKHNQYNGLAAAMTGEVVNIRKDNIREALSTFESLEHRLEPVATVRGVEFINDSKATNINSTWYALESMEKPTILILGGIDKGNDYTILKPLVQEKVKAIICMGVDNTKLNEEFGELVPLMINTSSAEEAVQAAYHFAIKGDAVLMSPACASFDLFKNYEDRGEKFKQAVKNL